VLTSDDANAHAQLDDPGRDDPVGRASHGSTLRSQLPGLPSEVGGGWPHRHRLQLYVIGSVQDGGVGTLSYMLRQPILAASKSGIAEPRPSAARSRLLGRGDDLFPVRRCGRAVSVGQGIRNL
jgi:hypothetical protein